MENPKQPEFGDNKFSRRRVLKMVGLAGVGAAVGMVAKQVSGKHHVLPSVPGDKAGQIGKMDKVPTTLKDDKEKTPQDVRESLERLKTNFNLRPDEFAIVVSPERQELYLTKNDEILKAYVISTGKEGMGSEMDSGKTPIGAHRVKEKIGDGAEIGTVFKGRQNMRYLADIVTDKIDNPQDDVTTRIMWLDGQEENINKGGNVDSHKRYTYIHGTPEEGLLGRPNSHGCIRMKNSDVIELFDIIPPETLVEIQNKAFKAS